MIILTALEASSVRGITSKGAALDPVQLVDTSYFLPERVIDDPAHASKTAILKPLPKRDLKWEELRTQPRDEFNAPVYPLKDAVQELKLDGTVKSIAVAEAPALDAKGK